MDDIAIIEKKYATELRRVKRQNRWMSFLAEKNGMWILMIVIVLNGAAVLRTLFALCPSTPMWVLRIGIPLFLILGIAVLPYTIFLSVRYEKRDKAFLDRLRDEHYCAETILALGNQYGIRGALEYAMKLRCQELGIDRLPESAVRDGRLPTEEEAAIIRSQMKK